MNHIIQIQVITLFLLLGAGVLARKVGYLPDPLPRGLSVLLLDVALPALVFVSFLRPFDPALLASAGRMLGYSLAVHLLLLAIAWPLFAWAPPDRRPTLRFVATFSNSGFMGIPMLAAVFPAGGVFHGAVFGVGFNLVCFTLGVSLFQRGAGRPDLRRLLLSPVLVATCAGLGCFLLSLRLPGPVTAGLGHLGAMTTPLSMLVVGAMLADARVRDILGGPGEYAAAAARLLLAPAVTLGFCLLLHVDPLLARILVLLQALPAATLVAVFGEKYGGDRAFISRCTFLSTALSLLTLPLAARAMERFLH